MFIDNDLQGLEEKVIFSKTDSKQKNIILSGAWKFSKKDHLYQKNILGDDVGCGMSAFIFEHIDQKYTYKEVSDVIANMYNKQNLLGRGNHFIDICDGLRIKGEEHYIPHYLIVIHTDGKQNNKKVPESIEEAQQKIRYSTLFRERIAEEIGTKLDLAHEKLGDWPHNTVEYERDSVVYRKGAIKTLPEKLHIFPGNMASDILFCSFQKDNLPRLSSMPHGSGRAGPLSKCKVSLEKAKNLRRLLYVPEIIKDTSLRSEHPDCYNDLSEVFLNLEPRPFIIYSVRILSYIGKI